MKKKILLLFVLSIVNISLLYGEGQTEILVRKSDSIYRMVNDKLVKLDNKAVTVKLKNGKALSKNVKAIRSNVLGYIDVEVPSDTDIEDFVANLKSTGDYELVKYNEIGEICVSSNDTEASNQWYLGAINMFSTWNITTGSPTIKVAVIDNGFDCAHEDIGYGNDHYRNIDPALGYDYYLMSSTSMTKKDHGTMVAGIISAKTNNGTGIAGVAGGFGGSGVKILPFCITDGTENYVNFGYLDDAICLAVDNGAKVINMSIGSTDIDLSHHVDVVDAIDYAYSHGVTLVAATGNSSNSSYSYLFFPACYSKVIAVGAMNQDYNKRPSSNYGNGLDLIAPGEGIYSTKKNNNYGYNSGTSFAAPQVAGVVALMLSKKPNLTPAQIRTVLRNTCTKLSDYSYNTSGWNEFVGYGLLNACAAVCSVASYISGPHSFCTAETYSIANLPTEATVNWSTNYCIDIVSGQGTDTIDVIKNSSGLGRITANIVYNGNVIKTLSLDDIGVGSPSLALMVFPQDENGNMSWDFTHAYNTFVVDDVVNQYYSYYQLYLYKQNGNSWTQVAYCSNAASGYTGIPYFGTNGWYKLKIRGSGNCGYSDWWELEVLTFDSDMYNNLQLSLDYQSSTDNLVIRMIPQGDTEVNPSQREPNEYIIQLWSETQLKKTVRTRSSECTIPVSDLRKGVYAVRVIYDGKSYSGKFVKK